MKKKSKRICGVKMTERFDLYRSIILALYNCKTGYTDFIYKLGLHQQILEKAFENTKPLGKI